jgi:hypothetical protein
MAIPNITQVSPMSGNVADSGVIITGTNLDGVDFQLNMYDSDFVAHNINNYVTYKSYNQVRFTIPNFVSGKYYLAIITSEGASNVI